MDIFTLESIDRISQYLSGAPGDTTLIDNFPNLADELNVQYVSVDYGIDPNVLDLVFPMSMKETLQSDRENLRLVFQAFQKLSPAQATDERLWATLSVRHYSKYTLARWALPKNEKKISSHIKHHWLCKAGARSRVRDNSISRLWWMGYIVNQLDGWHPDEVSDILFNNSDYRASILERSTSASSYNVVGAILSITDEAFKEGVKYNREKFRNFMRGVNFIAGRANLPALNQEQLIEMLRPIYRDCYDENKKGFLGIFSLG